MKIKFLSKIYIGTKRKISIISMVVVFICIVMLLCMLFKLLMDDFESSDLLGMLTPLLIVMVARNHRSEKHEYAYTDAELYFGADSLKITYAMVDGGKKIGFFSEETQIAYEDIDLIEYGKELSCFRIVANCIRKRLFYSTQKEFLIENGEMPAQTFLYVLDEDVADDVRKKLQNVSHSIIRIMEDQ